MGRQDEEGKNPVDESGSKESIIQSITGHEESSEKQGGPPSKAKYYLMTDREEVP